MARQPVLFWPDHSGEKSPLPRASAAARSGASAAVERGKGGCGAPRSGPSSRITRLTMPRAGRPVKSVVSAVWRAASLASIDAKTTKDVQTLAGAISTGTHGTGVTFGGLSTQVVGLTLVSGTGELVHIDENSELLPAARVGLGALGIIVEATLQCVPSFAIHAEERVEPVDDVVATFDERCTRTDHFEFFWFPHTDVAYTKTNIRLPAYTPLQPTSRISQWIEEELVENGVLGAICAVGSALPATVPVLNRTVTQLLSDRAHTQRSDRVFTSPRRVRFREMEYAVPYESVGAAFDEVRSLIAERDWRIGFPIEVRAAAADENWLSTAYGRDSAYIAVHRYVRDDPTEYFAAVEQIMRRYDGRPHWGKMHNRTAADLRDTYPRFDDFLAVREKLDPQRTFANSYLQQVLGE